MPQAGRHSRGRSSAQQKLVAVLLVAAAALPAATAAGQTSSVPYEVVDTGIYSSFVKSWDEVANPVSCAVIGSIAEWDEVFGAAALGTGDQVFSPPDAFFADRILLVASKLVHGAADTAYSIYSVTVDGDALVVDYTATGKDDTSSFTVSSTMALAVSRGEWNAVGFVENGNSVCRTER